MSAKPLIASVPAARSQQARATRNVSVLIPIKARLLCKQRLAPVLSPASRANLARELLARVLAAARAAHAVSEVIVVSPERDAIPRDIPVFADRGADLNEALRDARQRLLLRGCGPIVVLPADLPEVMAAEIDALIACGRRGGFALASDAGDRGTNALYLDSGADFDFCFGPDSRNRHLRAARRAGLTPRILCRPGLQFDVDRAADLYRLESRRCLPLRA